VAINRIKTVENILINDATYSLVKDKSDIISLINENYKTLQTIMSGNLNSKLLIDMDLLRAGTGINIVKNVNNQIEFSVVSQEYNLSQTISTSVKEDWVSTEYSYAYEIYLRELKNYIRLEENTGFIPNKDLKLYINDRLVKWATGQVYRIYFANEYEMGNSYGNFDMYIYTGDGTNQLVDSGVQTNGVSNISNRNWKLISKINTNDFQKRSNRPVLEIICTNSNKLEFKIDYLN
jgi:hypothetical protein